jgi:hypothetical protein
MESRGYMSEAYVAIAGNPTSEKLALKEAQEECKNKSRYYPTVWVKRMVEGKLVKYYACGGIDTNQPY